MKKEEYYMIREYNQYSLCKHLNNGMSISVTTIYAKNSGEAESMARKHTYHKENCDCLIREIIVDNYGREIILGGQHAFQYSISIISITGKITTTNYRNGKGARKEFYKYKRKK